MKKGGHNKGARPKRSVSKRLRDRTKRGPTVTSTCTKLALFRERLAKNLDGDR